MDKIREIIEDSFRKEGKSKYTVEIWFDNDPEDEKIIYEFFVESDDIAKDIATDRLYSELMERAREKNKDNMGKCRSRLYKEEKEILWE